MRLSSTLVGLLLAVGLVRLTGAVAERDHAHRRAVINVTLLVVLGALFAGWWEPANRKFWAPVLPGLLALAAVGWSGWPRTRPRLGLVVVVVAAAVAFSFNLAGGILPRHRIHDDRQPLVMFLARRVQPGDVVVLQDQSQLPAFAMAGPDGNPMLKQLDAGGPVLIRRIHEKHPEARVILFETWARHANPDKRDTLKKFGVADGAVMDLEGTMVNLRVAREDEPVNTDTSRANYGYHHICVQVEDIDAAYKELSDKDVEFLAPPVDAGENRIAFCKGPDEIVIEVLQAL